MNNFKKGWLIVTIIFLAGVVWALINSYVSLKYEVEEANLLTQMGNDITDKEHYLTERITWLWVMGGYLLVNMYFLVRNK